MAVFKGTPAKGEILVMSERERSSLGGNKPPVCLGKAHDAPVAVKFLNSEFKGSGRDIRVKSLQSGTKAGY